MQLVSDQTETRLDMILRGACRANIRLGSYNACRLHAKIRYALSPSQLKRFKDGHRKFKGLTQKTLYVIKQYDREIKLKRFLEGRIDRLKRLKGIRAPLIALQGGTESAGILQLRANMRSATARNKRIEGKRQARNDSARPGERC